MSKEQRHDWIDGTIDFMANLVEAVYQKNPAKVILHYLEIPVYSPLGLLEGNQEFDSIGFIGNVNKGLGDKFFKKIRYLFLNRMLSVQGLDKQNILDLRFLMFFL